MKLGKKTKVTKEITRQERNRKNNLRRIGVSAIAALVVFIALVIIQSSILNQEEKKNVYQVVKDIPSGTKITESNLDEYLGLKEVAVSLIPENYITDATVMTDLFVNRNYKAKDIITTDGLTDTEELYVSNIENPVEISFSVADLGVGVAGQIREGDYINIYGLRKEETESNGFSSDSIYVVNQLYTFKHVYVTKAFDGGGVRIEADGTTDSEEASVTLFSVTISEKDAELFNEMLRNCEIRLAKLSYDTDQDYQVFLSETNRTAEVKTTTTTEAQPTQENVNNNQNFWDQYTVEYYENMLNNEENAENADGESTDATAEGEEAANTESETPAENADATAGENAAN